MRFASLFLCAMWITGFDVPTCSTVYLDKPMKNHTLMQTIARANRRAPGKTAGVIVDYVGVFQNLQKALAIYAAKGSDSAPIKDKDSSSPRSRGPRGGPCVLHGGGRGCGRHLLQPRSSRGSR